MSYCLNFANIKMSDASGHTREKGVAMDQLHVHPFTHIWRGAATQPLALYLPGWPAMRSIVLQTAHPFAFFIFSSVFLAIFTLVKSRPSET